LRVWANPLAAFIGYAMYKWRASNNPGWRTRKWKVPSIQRISLINKNPEKVQWIFLATKKDPYAKGRNALL
jgi:hypothetical protein